MAPNTRTVHMVFKTHLDVGFTDYARNVIEGYFQHFIPNAIYLARTMRESDADARFVWTTGSWLIYEYLEQASPDERRLMEAAIIAGDIAWHGLPFTTHTELMDVSLFRYGLSLAQTLDKRFGKQTIAAKMTDVPGHTRGLVPLLAEAGITFLHIGVNPASSVPDVPPVFVWHDEGSNSDVVVMYHQDYGSTSVIDGLDDAISVILTGDNIGPQSPDDVRATFASMRQRFPNARVVASTLDAFASRLPAVKAQLPVITSEIGDTWVHGVGTDPAKVAGFRELSSLRTEWIKGGVVDADATDMGRFSRNLLLVAEHTWGMDEKTYLPERGCYDPTAFRMARQRDDFRRFEASWAEQREYLSAAVDSLTTAELRQEARARLAALRPERLTLEESEACDADTTYATTHFSVRFDRQGALSGLVQFSNGYRWADTSKRLGLVSYQTFSHEDYDRFYNQYNRNRDDPDVSVWAIEDFTKPGLESAHTSSADWLPTLTSLRRRVDDGGHHFLAELRMPEQATAVYGCPALFQVALYLPIHAPEVHFDVRWFDKPASRMPEALWLSFDPIIDEPEGWQLDKLGALVSPVDVVSRGARHLHAVDRGVMHPAGLSIVTLDAPLVAPGRRSLLRFDDALPPLENGMHFNLYNNVWGTNFPMWYEDDARFRFALRLTAR